MTRQTRNHSTRAEAASALEAQAVEADKPGILFQTVESSQKNGRAARDNNDGATASGDHFYTGQDIELRHGAHEVEVSHSGHSGEDGNTSSFSKPTRNMEISKSTAATDENGEAQNEHVGRHDGIRLAGNESDDGEEKESRPTNTLRSSLGRTSQMVREIFMEPNDRFWDEDVSPWKPDTVLRRIRLVCGSIVENPNVQLLVIGLIILNAIVMGIGTFDFVTENDNVEDIFAGIDRGFLVIFTIELGLQFLYRGLSLFTDGWLIFDLIVVVASWTLEKVQIIRAFRIFRALRLVARIGPLRELIMAIGAVMPRIYAIGMLLLLIFYIFAVLFTELFSSIETEFAQEYFGTLFRSLFTCMELMTMEWAGVARTIMAEKSWAWAPFVAFMAATGFIVFNLIVAVLCDAVSLVDQEVKAEKEGQTETPKVRLAVAQERIWDLTEQVEIMKSRQKELEIVLTALTSEVKLSTDAGPSQEISEDDTGARGAATTGKKKRLVRKVRRVPKAKDQNGDNNKNSTAQQAQDERSVAASSKSSQR